MNKARLHHHAHNLVEFGVAADLIVRAIHEPRTGTFVVAVPVILYMIVRRVFGRRMVATKGGRNHVVHRRTR